MAESWIDADEATIRNDVIEIAKAETGLTSFKSTGVLRGFLEVIARVVAHIYTTAINPVYANASLDGATGVFLSLWGLMLGVARKQEENAIGSFSASAYGDGSVPAGAWAVVDGTDLRYKVSATVTFQAGVPFSLPVTAEHAGSEYNISPGTVVRLTRVIPGFDSVSVGAGWITTLGQDIETDDAYRARIKDRWRSQSLGDTKEVYKYYAESVDGVRAAKIIRTPRGPGSTDVVVAAVNGIPGSELITAVEQALYAHELMGFDVRVKAPDVTAVSIQIEYSGSAAVADIRLIAENYVYGLGIGGRLKVRELYALYDAAEVDTIEILTPDRDVQSDESGIITATVSVVKVA